MKRKLDRWDYAAHFSSELLAVILVLGVAMANIFSFGLFTSGKEQDFRDESLAGQFLRQHTDLNQALFAKENSIKTTVIHSSGLINTVLADNTAMAADFNADNSADGNTEGEDDSIQDSVMVKPNPDTTRQLMDKQVQVYQTQEGETLASVAAKFNISQDTIKWANKLTSNTFGVGSYLKIPPTSGVLYQATSNDTLPDIAKYFNCNLDTLVSYNGLESAEDVDAGQWLICPGGSVPPPPPPPAPKPSAKPAAKQGTVSVPRGIPVKGSHVFPKGYCTWYAAQKWGGVPWGGNAKNWLGNARAMGYATASKPVAGAIMVTNDDRRYGHVAYVERINGNSIVISEMNYVGFGKISSRTVQVGDSSIKGFIYK